MCLTILLTQLFANTPALASAAILRSQPTPAAELAAPAPASDRAWAPFFRDGVAQTTTQIPNPHGPKVTASASCPDPAHDVPIGGSCDGGADADAYRQTWTFSPVEARYSCTFRQKPDNDAPLLVTVLCAVHVR